MPFGPASPVLWIRHGAGTPLKQDRAAATRLLAARGWADHDGDGVLDRNGVPLALGLSYPVTSGLRRTMAQLIQEQYRQIGIRVDLVQLEFPVWLERRDAGDFDIDFSSTVQDPSPSGLTQSWTCAGGTNRAHYCDPGVDSLVTRAIAAGKSFDSGRSPPSPWIGSAMIAAVLLVTAASRPATSSSATKVTPGISGPNGSR